MKKLTSLQVLILASLMLSSFPTHCKTAPTTIGLATISSAASQVKVDAQQQVAQQKKSKQTQAQTQVQAQASAVKQTAANSTASKQFAKLASQKIQQQIENKKTQTRETISETRAGSTSTSRAQSLHTNKTVRTTLSKNYTQPVTT